jgi:hypothetical protein
LLRLLSMRSEKPTKGALILMSSENNLEETRNRALRLENLSYATYLKHNCVW